MASLRKRKGSNVWQAQYYVPDAGTGGLARYNGHLDAFLVWLGDDRRKRPLESVTPQHVREWRESLQDAGRAGNTVLSYVKDLGAV